MNLYYTHPLEKYDVWEITRLINLEKNDTERNIYYAIDLFDHVFMTFHLTSYYCTCI